MHWCNNSEALEYIYKQQQNRKKPLFMCINRYKVCQGWDWNLCSLPHIG